MRIFNCFGKREEKKIYHYEIFLFSHLENVEFLYHDKEFSSQELYDLLKKIKETVKEDDYYHTTYEILRILKDEYGFMEYHPNIEEIFFEYDSFEEELEAEA